MQGRTVVMQTERRACYQTAAVFVAMSAQVDWVEHSVLVQARAVPGNEVVTFSDMWAKKRDGLHP